MKRRLTKRTVLICDVTQYFHDTRCVAPLSTSDLVSTMKHGVILALPKFVDWVQIPINTGDASPGVSAGDFPGS